ncbi:MAG TPA: putative lipid II flippase FtsW [Candidatus Acidoferrum sp.]|nr:putative lipid II flippase FtsW [Candidatus Acidoferrum sp.]
MTTLTMPHTLSTRQYYGDPILIMLTALLLAFGLVMMTSASIEVGNSDFGDPFFYFKRQLAFLVIGLGLAVAIILNPMRLWYRSSVLLLFISYLLLVLVLIPGVGRNVNGATRWIALPGFSLQPSEIAKLLVVMFTAWFLSRHRELVQSSLRGLVYPALLLGPVVALLLLEPDFGATVVLCLAVMGMMFLGGINLFYMLLAGSILGGGAVLAVVTSAYRMHRFNTYMQMVDNPFGSDVVFGAGYQLAQSLIGFGRGGWFGVGLGNSIQKMYFLPEAHTDFVLAIIAEELGLAGVIVLLVLFFAFIARALMLARRNETSGRLFAAYLGYGISLLFLGQLVINSAVNVGLMPTKGLTLPFLSYGGSSLIMSIVMVAILLRIDIEHHLYTNQPRAAGQVRNPEVPR